MLNPSASANKTLLVIDDEPLILEMVKLCFTDYNVVTASNAADGLREFRKHRPDVVLSDIRLPDLSGLELFEKLHTVDNRVPIILMTGQGRAGTAIEAMQKGAFEYVLKPLDPDLLTPIIQSAYESSRLMRVPTSLPSDATNDSEGELLIGKCAAMQDVYRAIGRVASQNVTVLILGESGTGKEVISRAIYNYSHRATKKFLAINCAAIPVPLLESELFGHEKGAFTGADRKRIGKFEQTHGGTLFLDEIGDMPPLMQTKILRILQDQTFERVGGSEIIQTDVRLITATNRDLQAMIETHEFRSDLFYRLNSYTIQLPPLRERGQDTLLLADHFCRIYAAQLGKDPTTIPSETQNILMQYRWPGNVRELQSVIKRALLEATGPMLVPACLPSFMQPPTPSRSQSKSGDSREPTRTSSSPLSQFSPPTESWGDAESTEWQPDMSDEDSHETVAQLIERHCQQSDEKIYESVVEEIERQMISKVLNACRGNQTEAARRLGVTRTTIRSKIAKLSIDIQKVTD